MQDQARSGRPPNSMTYGYQSETYFILLSAEAFQPNQLGGN